MPHPLHKARLRQRGEVDTQEGGKGCSRSSDVRQLLRVQFSIIRHVHCHFLFVYRVCGVLTHMSCTFCREQPSADCYISFAGISRLPTRNSRPARPSTPITPAISISVGT